MKILKDNHCPNCGLALERVRLGVKGTPCGLFHAHPGVARLVIDVVNNERDDIKSTFYDNGDILTTTVGIDTYPDVVAAVTAVLDDLNEIVFPD